MTETLAFVVILLRVFLRQSGLAALDILPDEHLKIFFSDLVFLLQNFWMESKLLQMLELC